MTARQMAFDTQAHNRANFYSTLWN